MGGDSEAQQTVRSSGGAVVTLRVERVVFESEVQRGTNKQGCQPSPTGKEEEEFVDPVTTLMTTRPRACVESGARQSELLPLPPPLSPTGRSSYLVAPGKRVSTTISREPTRLST